MRLRAVRRSMLVDCQVRSWAESMNVRGRDSGAVAEIARLTWTIG